MFFRLRPGLDLVAILFATLSLPGCEQAQFAPPPPPTVSVYEVAPAEINRQQTFYGQVVPADLTKVAFRIPGKIDRLAVQSGQEVEAGQVIATIENSIQAQALTDAQAQFELSKRQLERASNLLAIGAITPAARDELNANFRLARANLKLAQATLTYTVLSAPFSGTVVDVDKELYESVSPGETVATVYRTDRIDVLVNIPDGLPARIHQADNSEAYKARATFSGHSQEYAMQHLKHSTARNPQLEAFQIWLSMPAPEIALPPGVPATLEVNLESAGFRLESAQVVPLTALQAGSESGRFNVWRYQRGTVEPVAVEVERVSRNGALISAGLQVGDLILTSGLSSLAPGQAVNIVRPDRTGAEAL